MLWTKETAACFYCKLTVVINNNYQHSVGIMILFWPSSFKLFLFIFYCNFLSRVGEPNSCQSDHYIQSTLPSKIYLQLDLHCFYKFIKNMCCPVPGIATENAGDVSLCADGQNGLSSPGWSEVLCNVVLERWTC